MNTNQWEAKSDGELLLALDAAGDRVPRALLDELLRRGERLVPALLDRATDPTRWESDSFERFVSALHALNLLGALQAAGAVEPLIAFVAERPEAPLLIGQIPAVFGRISEPAVEPLLSALFGGASEDAKIILCLSLSSVALKDDGLKSRICTTVRARLPQVQDIETVLFCARMLGELKDTASLLIVRHALTAHGVGEKSEVWTDLKELFGTRQAVAATRRECVREPAEHFEPGNLRRLRQEFASEQTALVDEDEIPSTPEELLEQLLDLMPDVRETLSQLPGGRQQALELICQMPCPCGSGKPAFACHLSETAAADDQEMSEDEVVVDEAEVAGLPQSDDVWEMADIHLGAYTLDDDGVPQPTHLAAVADADSGILHGMSAVLGMPTADTFRQLALKACAHPQLGAPRRPALIRVDDVALMADLVPLSERLGFEVEQSSVLPAIREAEEGMRELAEADGFVEQRPGLMETPGVTEPAVAGAFRAAASFYRKAPWRHFGEELPIEIQTDLASGGSCVAVVMGQLGECEGLALYDSREALTRFVEAVEEGPDSAMETAACLNMYYAALEDLPADDHRNAVQHQWPAANKSAYPFFFRLEPDHEMRRPFPRELALFEAALRAVPRFLDKHVVDGSLPGPVEETMKVKTVVGTQTVQLVCDPEDVM